MNTQVQNQLTKEEELAMEEFCAQSFDFARQNDVASLKIMLDSGLSVNFSNHKGDTLLMLASYHNAIDVVRLLLEHGADVDRVNNRNQTPLAGVCFKGYEEVAKMLLDHGADPYAGGGMSPFNCAVMFRRDKILQMILQKSGKKLNIFQYLYLKISSLFMRKKS